MNAERAVRARLAVVAAVRSIEAAEPLEVRIGIATGLVVVGDLIGEGEAQERGVVGEFDHSAMFASRSCRGRAGTNRPMTPCRTRNRPVPNSRVTSRHLRRGTPSDRPTEG